MYAGAATGSQAEPLRILPAPSERRWRWHSPARVASSIVLGIVVILVVVVTVGMVLGRERFAVVDSGSMRPTLNPGDVAVLTSERTALASDGQIVAFHPPGQPHVTVIHRIRSIERSGGGLVIQTKGDANNATDPWRARIAGGTVWKESLKVPWVGYLVAWSQRQLIRLLVLTVMLALMVSIALRWIWRPTQR